VKQSVFKRVSAAYHYLRAQKIEVSDYLGGVQLSRRCPTVYGFKNLRRHCGEGSVDLSKVEDLIGIKDDINQRAEEECEAKKSMTTKTG
jgi:hypothetical protein